MVLISKLWEKMNLNEEITNEFRRQLGGNKPGIELTPDIIVKKSSLTKQMLAEGFLKLMSMIDEDTQFLKEAAEELVTEKSKNVKSSDSIIKLQADLIECQKNNIEALEVTFDKKASEVVDKLSEKMLEIPEPCSTDNNSMSKSVKDWSKIDFTTSITNAVAHSLKSETIKNVVTNSVRLQNIKERQRADRNSNVMVFGVKPMDSMMSDEQQIYKVLDELCISTEDVALCSQVSTTSDSAKGSTFRVKMKHQAFVTKALRNAKNLKAMGDGYNNVFLAPDRTPAQQQKQKKLVSKLKEKIKAHPLRRWVIKGDEIVDGGQFSTEEEVDQ